MKLAADCRIKQGKLEFKQRSSFLTDLSAFPDGDYVITIEKAKKKRSIEQNRYYFGVVIPLVKNGLNDIGYRITSEGVHEFLKSEFNIVELINEQNGEILKTVGSTSNMSTTEINDYFLKITQWAAEFLNIQIPQPGEQIKICV